MSEEILINNTPTETRVALVESGLLQEVWLERASHHGYVGNIYKGKVSRVLPGIQAAFVDIGLERTAFLHASDMVRTHTELLEQQLSPGEHAIPAPRVQDLVAEGSEVVVQVIKDPLGSKGARLTTNLSIPSRFLVLLPNCDSIGISIRIEDPEERQRLTDIVVSLRPADEAHGYIVRTNAERADAFALSADMTYLRKVWQSLRELTMTIGPGECIYRDLTLPLKVLRDLMHSNVEKIRIDSAPVCEQMSEFAQRFIPDWCARIEYHDSERPIFDLYGIEQEISQALDRRTELKSGGYLVIDQTEALTTIDVNTGAFVGHRDQQETIFKTNLEAAQAIARQLRLRNLGGIIIIDFIDMVQSAHQEQLLTTLEKALDRDRARTRIYGLTGLGLVEMTRKRTTESLGHLLCEPCPVCNGLGKISTAESVCLAVFREIMRSGRQFEAQRLLVMASPKVIDYIMDEQSEKVAELEEITGRSIRLQSEAQYHQEQFDVVLL